nr:hypothetical protein [Vulcanimicrobium alpinum]
MGGVERRALHAIRARAATAGAISSASAVIFRSPAMVLLEMLLPIMHIRDEAEKAVLR